MNKKKPTTAATATTSLFISLYLSLWRVVLVAVWCGVVNLMIAGRIDIVLSERKSTGAP